MTATLTLILFADLLEKPGLDLGTDGVPKLEPGLGAGDIDDSKGTGGGKFRLLLVDSIKHSETKVVAAITTVVPGVTRDQAANCYHTAKKLGLAMVRTRLLRRLLQVSRIHSCQHLAHMSCIHLSLLQTCPTRCSTAARVTIVCKLAQW